MVFREFVYLIAEEKTSENDDINSNSSSTMFGLIEFFLYSTFFIRIYKFFSSFRFLLLCQLYSEDSDEIREEKIIETESNIRRESGEIERDEVKIVMEKMGIFCRSESEELDEKYGSKELSELFEEQEPSLEEVKQAFDVFDENKDGFIDAEELQRVMCILGLKEGLEVQNCQKMIKNFDENQDGRIDFIEFVKIMENRLC
ncbi:probable calcium-binding protein CML46 [Cicer arietinum]|uniref:Probable calcium-binding protein CML45 n=1 Tax=Cicer arietinum TaxID=3827 RepID=A0A1S2XMZ6_CICAR|nr:probable calcium-binding protein CML45 [Cicer arietinum]